MTPFNSREEVGMVALSSATIAPVLFVAYIKTTFWVWQPWIIVVASLLEILFILRFKFRNTTSFIVLWTLLLLWSVGLGFYNLDSGQALSDGMGFDGLPVIFILIAVFSTAMTSLRSRLNTKTS